MNGEKSWDFPRMHTQFYTIWDIMKKDATHNYNTKPSEKVNGPLKKYYHNHTNFKNVVPQVIFYPTVLAHKYLTPTF